MHESSSALTQLHGVVISGGTVGSVRGVWGAMIVSVVPILVMVRFSMSHVEVPVGLVVVALAMEAYVAGWPRNMWRSLCICRVGLWSRWCRRWSRVAGTMERTRSTLVDIRRDLVKRVHC